MGPNSVSAVITAYNSAPYIADALASIRSQRTPPDEIIVIDDGSSDNTGAIVRKFGDDIHYIHQSNRGEAAARNLGVAAAKGDIIAFLDADDAWPADRLTSLLDWFRNNKMSIICGRARAFRGISWTEAAACENPDFEGFLMSFGCALIKRVVFDQVGPIDESMQHGVDLDWFLRCREKQVPILVIQDIVLLYRRHESNMTRNVVAGRDGLMQTIRQSLQRRRRTQSGAESLAVWESLGNSSK